MVYSCLDAPSASAPSAASTEVTGRKERAGLLGNDNFAARFTDLQLLLP